MVCIVNGEYVVYAQNNGHFWENVLTWISVKTK